MKTLEDEWYIVVKAYKFTIFEILISYIACPPLNHRPVTLLSPVTPFSPVTPPLNHHPPSLLHRVYRLYDLRMVNDHSHTGSECRNMVI